MQLLANGGVGRLVYNSRYGPTALPTVYRIDGESVVLGTWDPALFDEDLRTGIAHAEYRVAVEADQLDLEAREGWIVLVRGAAHHWLGSQRCGAFERSPVFRPGVSQRIALQNLPEVPGKTTSSKCSVILGSGGSASLRRSRGLSAGVTSSR